MANYSMCFGNNCSKKKICWRFMAKPSSWQSFIDGYCDDDGNCKDFISMIPEPTHKSSFDYEAEYRAKLNERTVES